MTLKFYQYPKCSTCRKAKQFLDAAGVDYEDIDITKQPPSKKDLKAMLKQQGELRKLFNTSGMIYRERGLKDELPEMSESEAFEMLSAEGKLVKRPFLLGEDLGLVGFRQTQWEEALAVRS